MTRAIAGAPAWAAATFSPTPYPGHIPSFSYVMEKGFVRALSGGDADYCLDDGVSLREWLAGPVGGHVPLLVYGSNACPGRLLQKFPSCGGDGIVLLRGRLEGAVRAWSRNPSSTGSVPMTLVQGSEASSDAHLMLLPHRLAEAMEASEGRGGPFYALARLTSCRLILDNGVVWEAPLTYVGHSERGPLVHLGEPVVDTSLTQQEVLALIVANGTYEGDSFLPPMEVVPRGTSLIDTVEAGPDRSLRRWLDGDRGVST